MFKKPSWWLETYIKYCKQKDSGYSKFSRLFHKLTVCRLETRHLYTSYSILATLYFHPHKPNHPIHKAYNLPHKNKPEE
jgi:hypothetical protein